MGIRLDSVTKRYGSTVALDHLSFEFPEGRLTGFLGPNGAGKTTTFRVCLGLTRPQEGRVEVLGLQVGPDTPRIVKRVGAVVEEPGLHKTLDAIDNLRVAAMILGRGAGEIPALLEFVDLTRDARRKVETYSKGMRQRLALAIAMLGDPDVLFLDEPLDGLDPAGQVVFRDRLRALVDEHGKTVVVSSHDMSDVEQLADHVVVISRGKLVASGPLAEVLGTSDSFRVAVADPDQARTVLTAAGIESAVDGGGLLARASDGAIISRALAGAGIYPSALVPQAASLEQVFLELTAGE